MTPPWLKHKVEIVVRRGCSEEGVGTETAEPYSFAYIDKINKTMRKNFNENI